MKKYFMSKKSIFVVTAIIISCFLVSFFIGQPVNATTTYDDFDRDITIKDDDEEVVISGKGCTTDHKYEIDEDVEGATLHLKPSSDLVMDSTDEEHSPIRLKEGANATVIIDGNVTLKGGHDTGIGENNGHAALSVAKDATLNLIVNGTLKTYGGDGGDGRGAAGIGSDDDETCGDINITVNDGGSIESYGYHGAAGIGGGDDGSINNINIKGSSKNTSIKATGDAGGAGIGGASDGKLESLVIDNIGTIEATGGRKATGIGGGDHDGTGDGGTVGTVVVQNCGTVTATGNDGGAGIGSGEDAGMSSVSVLNCDEVTATGGKDGAGIGSGRDSTSGIEVFAGKAIVKNSKVKAVCPEGTGAGIGAGASSHMTSVEIEGQKDITALGHGDGCGIGYSGGGLSAQGSRSVNKIIINDVRGNLIATAGDNGAGIGLGDVQLDDDYPTTGTITITMNGGSIDAKATGSNNAGIGGGRPSGDRCNIRKISISGNGSIKAHGTAGGSAIGSGDDSNVVDGIEILGTDGGRNLTLEVGCSNPDKGMANCPLIGIDNPVNDEDESADIIIKNADIKATVAKSDGRSAAVVIGGGEFAGMTQHVGWINKIELDNCNISMSGDSGIGVGGNLRTSVGEIIINNTDYDGFAIGSMGYNDATLFNGDITTTMGKINITNSNVKAIAKFKQANTSCQLTMSGIGGGNKTWVDEINIDNSNVTAKGALGGAGIGGGGYTYLSTFYGDFFTVYGDMGASFGDKINITNSTVDAEGSEGQIFEYYRQVPVINYEGEVETVEYLTRNFCGCAAGIGGGGFQSFNEINISNSEVNAKAAGGIITTDDESKNQEIDSGAAAIGGGTMGTCENITIDNNSKVTATGTHGGAAIGSGGEDPQVEESLFKIFNKDLGNPLVNQIKIAGGSEVTAYGGFYGAGIGTGERGTLRNISISDSKVNSTGGDGAAGIGGGTNSKVSDANVSITGSSEVISLGGVGGAGIGTGVIFSKQNPGDTDVFGQVCISDNSSVHADGGPGAAGIGGGSGENNYLAEELLWDSGKSRSAGTVGTFTMNRTDIGDPLVIAASGYNYIDELYSNVEYKTAPVDVGQGGSFIENDSPQSTTMQINGGTLLSLGSDKYSKWNESFRSSLNGNALAPDKSSKHLDNNEDDRNDVYRVSLRVPDIETYTRINVSVTGDGSTDKEGDAYYDNTPLYTDGEGMVYLWLGEGATDATNAEVTVDGKTYHYFGTCTNDNNGRLNMIAEVVLEDNFDKVYDGELIEEPPLKVCSGDGKVSYTYYKYKWEEGTSTEADLTEDLIVPRREVKDAGDYTVRVDMSAGEFCGAAYDIGGFAITPAETKISAIIGHKSTKGIELTAFVNGLVENDQDYGTVYFVIRQGSGIVETSKDVDVNSNGRADITIDGSAIPAGTYTIYAYFRCNPDKKNYYNSQDSKDYDFSKLTAQIEMDPIEITYNDDDIYVPGSTYKPTVTVIGGSSEDVENVTSALQYSMINPANDIAVYSGGKITTLNAGKTYMLIKYTGSERINPAATIVSVIVKRKPVTAIPLVSVLERDDTWTNYEHEAMTTYKRTENEKYLRYKVMYTDDNLELAGLNLTEVVPLGSRVFSSYEDYDVQLIRKKLTRNYAVTLGEPAKVYVGKAARDVKVRCADVTFGELPRPSTYCDIPFLQRELTYVYEGTTNSGRSIARTFIPPLQAGEYTVTAVLSERYNYTYANSEPYSFTIKRADLEPVVHIENYTYGDATNIFVTGNKGTGEVTYTYYKDSECRIPTSALDGADHLGGEPKNVGKYFAVAHIDETNNFNEAYSLPAEFKILRKSVEVKADDKVKIVNHNDPEFTATVTGLINNDTIDYTLSRNPGEAIGDYTITPSGEAEQGNYDITFTTGKFIISQGYTLYFDLDGGTIDGQSGSIEYIGLVDGDVITIPGPPEKAGYEFLYWEGSRYYPGDQYVVHGKHNFKAVWKEAYGSGSSKYGKGSRLLTGDNAMSIYSLAAILILAIIVVSVSVVQARKKQS